MGAALAERHRVGPMKCKGMEELRAGEGWLYEIKWDGHRLVVHVDGEGDVALDSSQLNDVTGRYPEIIAELATISRQAVFDGEIVGFEGDQATFQTLSTGVKRYV